MGNQGLGQQWTISPLLWPWFFPSCFLRENLFLKGGICETPVGPLGNPH